MEELAKTVAHARCAYYPLGWLGGMRVLRLMQSGQVG